MHWQCAQYFTLVFVILRGRGVALFSVRGGCGHRARGEGFHRRVVATATAMEANEQKKTQRRETKRVKCSIAIPHRRRQLKNRYGGKNGQTDVKWKDEGAWAGLWTEEISVVVW